MTLSKLIRKLFRPKIIVQKHFVKDVDLIAKRNAIHSQLAKEQGKEWRGGRHG